MEPVIPHWLKARRGHRYFLSVAENMDCSPEAKRKTELSARKEVIFRQRKTAKKSKIILLK